MIKLLVKGDGPDSFLGTLTSRGIVFLAGSSESQVLWPLAGEAAFGVMLDAGKGRFRQKVHCPLL